MNLRKVWKRTRPGNEMSAYATIANAYADLRVNRADPHAYNRMLTQLKGGVEKPLDPIFDRQGNLVGDRGVIPWIENRLLQQAKEDRERAAA